MMETIGQEIMLMDIEEMREKLRSGSHQVVFTKVDGTERKMTCTLDESFIPQAFWPKSEGEKRRKTAATPANLLQVFDIENQGWRSFRFENVISFA